MTRGPPCGRRCDLVPPQRRVMSHAAGYLRQRRRLPSRIGPATPTDGQRRGPKGALCRRYGRPRGTKHGSSRASNRCAVSGHPCRRGFAPRPRGPAQRQGAAGASHGGRAKVHRDFRPGRFEALVRHETGLPKVSLIPAHGHGIRPSCAGVGLPRDRLAAPGMAGG